MDERRTFNRRAHERFALPAMYTVVQATREAGTILDGHAYDISEGGARIELDEPLTEGEHVDLSLTLPGASDRVLAKASVIRVHDEDDDPGPRRMGIRFSEFVSSTDRERLIRFLGSGAMRVAA